MARGPFHISKRYSPEELRDLFNALSDWEDILKYIDWDALEDPSPQKPKGPRP